MKINQFLSAALLALGPALLCAQAGAADSMTAIVTSYQNMGKDTAVGKSVEQLQKQHAEMSHALAEAEGSLQALEQARRAEQEAKYRRRLRRICQAPEFVRAANVSLGALTLSNTLTDYLNDVGSLNNPENEELGLSMNSTISKLIDDKIFHGKQKVGRQPKGRFLTVASTIVHSPLVTGLTGVIPVVSSLGAVTDLVSSLVANNEEVPMEDYESYKKEVAGYVAFYEALGHAGNQFNSKINNLGLRIQVLENLLRNFAVERTGALFPEYQAGDGQPISLNDLLRNQFEREQITKLVADLEQVKRTADGQADFGALLDDGRLAFPDFAVNQARFIADELLSISKEYTAALETYQTDIEAVLAGSPNIVATEKAEKKTAKLRSKLTQLEKVFDAAVNLDDVQGRFQKLVGIGG